MPGSLRIHRAAGLAVLLLASTACDGKPKSAERAAIPAAPDAAIATTDLPFSPLERRNALATIYRPAPDRRFLRAFDEVERVITGKPPVAAATARFDGGKWTVTVGNREVARLSEFPTFDEALAAITSHAKELAKSWTLEGSVPADGPTIPFDDEAFAALTAAQEAWSKGPTRGALHDAAKALTSLTFVAANGMDLGDDLPARALAVLALDKAMSAPTGSLESILAAGLSYRTSSDKLAAQLPIGDPFRQYLLDEPALAKAARTPGAPLWTRYLWARRLTAKYERLEEGSFRRSAFPDGDIRLPILALRSGYGEFAERREVAGLYPAAAMLETGTAAGVEDAVSATKKLREMPLNDLTATEQAIRALLATKRGDTLVRFDRDLPNVGRSDKGPFLDGELHRAYLRGFMYSAEAAEVLFDLDWYSSAPAAKKLLDALVATSSTEAKEFKAWGLTTVALAQGVDPGGAIPHISGPSPFGYGPRSRIARAVLHRANYGDGTAQKAARQLAPFLDTRPNVLNAFADIAWNSLYDLRTGEKYWREVGAVAPHFTNVRRWLAQRDKDEAALRALWADETLGSSARIEILGALEWMGGVSASEADVEIDRLLAKSDDWPARNSATWHLVGHGRYEKARKIVKDWLSRNGDAPGLEPTAARVRVAESFEREKRWREALDAVTPALESWHWDALSHAALAHARLGHNAEALELTKKMLGRYPAANSMWVGANVRWLARDYDGAADFLAHPPPEVRLRNKDWQDMGGAFVASFAGAPAGAPKAIDALLAKGIPVESVMQMAWDAWRRNESELAFGIITRPPPPADRPHHVGRLVNAYTMLRTWKNEQAAADWLRPQIKPEESITLASFAMEFGEEPLLWSVVSESGAPADIEKIWALRAASARRTKSLRPKLADVRAHYEASPGGGGYWNVIGRYLAGLADDATVAALARDPKSSAEVAFYMGARAHGEGRFDDASDFYRCALEGDVRDVKEAAQARSTLVRFKRAGVPLAKLDEVPFPAVPSAKPEAAAALDEGAK